MSTYTPDRWVIVEIGKKGYPTDRKVLAGWSGSYLEGQSWKLSSGITKETEHDDRYEFENYSGSVYVCSKGDYGFNFITMSVYTDFKKQFEDTEYLFEIVDDKKYEGK